MSSSQGTPGVREQRADSTSSSTSTASTATRRASLFASLEQQKRSMDPTQLARRQSMHDQRPKPTMLGRWWNSYVYGPASSGNPK